MAIPAVIITKQDINKCLDFSRNIINTNNQYNRFSKSKNIQIERTFIGKLAEYVFYKYLLEIGIQYSLGDMFDIFPGTLNVDSYDFQLKNGKTVDIKTASKPFHKRIMVPITQWNLAKDFYVGIKLETNCDKRGNIIPESISKALIYGYCTREQLSQSKTQNFGDGPCKHILLNNLTNIKYLSS